MMKAFRHFLSACSVAVLAAVAAGPAEAQVQAPAAPAGAGPLRLVAGFPAGGALDTLARAPAWKPPDCPARS